MGLSGSLDAFPLSEVLKQLSRSGHTGRLSARSDSLEMRAYLQGGRLLVAWSGDDSMLGTRLVERGVIAADRWGDVESGVISCDDAVVAGVSPMALDRAIREVTIEGLARMVDGRDGSYEFQEGVTTSLRMSTELAIEPVLDGVDRLLERWRDQPDEAATEDPIRFALVEPDSTVEMTGESWNLLVGLMPDRSLDGMAALTGLDSDAVLGLLEGLVEQPTEVVTAVDDQQFEAESDLEPEADADVDADLDTDAEVPAEPLAAMGPTGWENHLLSIPAQPEGGEALPEEEEVPLLGVDESEFLGEISATKPDGFDFGLVGFDVEPVKGPNLLEKDSSWGALDAHLNKLEELFGDEDEDLVIISSATDDRDDARPELPQPEEHDDRDDARHEAEAEDVRDDESDLTPSSESPVAESESASASLGTVLSHLDTVLADDEEPEGDEDDGEDADDTFVDPTDAEVDMPAGEPVDGHQPDEVEEQAAAREPEAGADALDEPETEHLDELAAVLSRLDVEGSLDAFDEDDDVDALFPDEPEDEPAAPYAAADASDAAGDRSPGDERADHSEDADAETPDRELPNILRRRTRGVLAKELRSLSD